MLRRIAVAAAIMMHAVGISVHGVPAQVTPPATRVVLRGSVRDARTHDPIEGVAVRGGDGAVGSTDEKGDFAMSVQAGQPINLLLRRLGYDSLTVALDSVSERHYEFALERAPRTLDTVAVDARAKSWSPKLEGFEQRLARRNGGTFYTREDIEQRRPLTVSDLVRRSPGVRVVDSMGVRLFASSRGNKISDSPRSGRKSVPCIMRVGLDGQVMEWGFAADQVATTEIYGIEVYSGPATVPREYASQVADGYCGLVMIWTR